MSGSCADRLNPRPFRLGHTACCPSGGVLAHNPLLCARWILSLNERPRGLRGERGVHAPGGDVGSWTLLP